MPRPGKTFWPATLLISTRRAIACEIFLQKFSGRLKVAIAQRDTMHGTVSVATTGGVTENPVSDVGNSLADMLHHDDT